MAVLSFAVHLVVVVAIAFQLYRSQVLNKAVFWPALSVKLASGICLGLLYSYYYSESDTFSYFRDASRLVSLAGADPVAYLQLMIHNSGMDTIGLESPEERALFLTKIISVLNLITGNNYWATGLYLSLTSFLASWFLVSVITRNLPATRFASIVGFLFLPTAIFWTSGVLKESLAVAGLFYLVAIFLKVWFREKIPLWQWMMVPVAFWILWNLKYYYAGIFMGVTGTTLMYALIVRERVSLNAVTEFFVWSLMLIVPITLVSLLHPNFYLDRLLSVVTANNAAYVALSEPGDYVQFDNLMPSAGSMLLNTPLALFSGLFRPLFWETSSFIQFLAGLENTFLLLFFTGALFRVKSYARSPYRLLLLTAMFYILLLCIFITLSAPNFGTLSRYRTGYIGFFTFLVLCNNPMFKYVERTITRLATN